MKKLMFALALVSLVFTSAQAQKQLGGEHNIEVNLTPFAGFSSMSDSSGAQTMFGGNVIDASTLKYRYFIDDDKALRVTLMLNTSSDVFTYIQDGEQYMGNGENNSSPQLHLGTSTTGFGLGLGYEIHFDGTDNLSPYFGFEGYFKTSKRKDYMEHWGPTSVDMMDFEDIGEWGTWTLYNEQGSNEFGLNLLFGADYYFNDAIYVGFEAGLGIGVTSVGTHTISASDVVAFNIQYNNAATLADPANNSTAELDSYNGWMPFDAALFDLYNNGTDTPFIIPPEGVDYSENPYAQPQGYENDGPHPNQLSGLSLGNVFNSAIRVGFLFD